MKIDFQPHRLGHAGPKLANAAATLLLALASPVVLAQSGPAPAGQSSAWWPDLSSGWSTANWRAVVSPYAPHLRPSDEHSDVWAVGLERQRPDHWLAGASFFSNSFGQPSGYFYLGKRFPGLLGQPQLFGQFSAGVLYGYRGKYQNKVPFNHNGFSPGALLSVGWQFNRRASLTLHAVGDAAVMLQLGWDLPD